MAGRANAVIEFGREQLRAVWGDVPKNQDALLEIQGVLVEAYPEGLDRDDPNAVGEWARDLLQAGTFPSGGTIRLILAIGRELVGLKCMDFPGADEDDLPEMTRLAMRREMSFDAADAVIDYIPIENGENATRVLGVAVPASVLSFGKDAAGVMGLWLERITMRSMGTASVVGGGGATMLAIDVTRGAVDFCMVENGVIRFSRAAELEYHDEPGVIAEQVVTETRRTWMSYRITEETRGAGRVVLLGDRQVIDHARGPIADMMRLPAEVVEGHSRVRDGGYDLGSVWPLVGLLLESREERAGINFLKPRQAPDRGAGKRQRILVGVVLLILTTVMLWWMGQGELSDMNDELADLVKTQRSLQPKYTAFHRQRYQIEHLRQWETASPDWLAHVQKIGVLSPPVTEMVLDSWTGGLEFRGVKFDKKTKKWSAPKQLSIVIDGEAKDRATADAFRAILVKEHGYVTSSSGSDAGGGKRLPVGFTYRLRTDAVIPPVDEKANEAKSGDAVEEELP